MELTVGEGGEERKQISNCHLFNKLLLSAYSVPGPVQETHNTDELNPDLVEAPSLSGGRQVNGQL